MRKTVEYCCFVDPVENVTFTSAEHLDASCAGDGDNIIIPRSIRGRNNYSIDSRYNAYPTGDVVDDRYSGPIWQAEQNFPREPARLNPGLDNRAYSSGFDQAVQLPSTTRL